MKYEYDALVAVLPAWIPRKIESYVPVTPFPEPGSPVEKRFEELTIVIGEAAPISLV